MLKQLRAALVLFIAFSILGGVVYPLVVTGIAKAAFGWQAEGSLRPDGHGSELIGQNFDDPRYFWGRLSATSDADGKALPYNAANSSGSNLGPTNPALSDQANSRLAALKAADPGNTQPVPVDLATASASGLDPEISPAAAEYQVHRVATARHMSQDAVRAIVGRCTRGRTFGILGEPRVNVLELNSQLDAAASAGK